MPDNSFVHFYHPSKGEGTKTLLLLHGTGGDENSLVAIAEMIAADAAVLSVRGKVLENGAPRFFRRLAEGVFDLEDLRFRTHELADFLVSASIEFGIDLASLVAVGYSNGANIASSLLLLRPETLAGGILLRAMVPFEPEARLDLSGKRVFISEGKYDPLVPVDNARRLVQMFQELGSEVTENWVEADHRLTRSEIEAASEWLIRA